MRVIFKAHFAKAALLDIFPTGLLIEFFGNQPSLKFFDRNLHELWCYPIQEISMLYLRRDLISFYWYEAGESKVIDLTNGRVIEQEPRIYIYSDSDIKAYVENSDEANLVIQKHGNKVSIPDVNGECVFGPTRLLRDWYKKKLTETYSSDDGELLWQVKYADLLQSEKAFLHSNIVAHNDKVYLSVDGTEDRGMFCLDCISGQVLNKYESIIGRIINDNNIIYSLFSNEIVYLHLETEQLNVWSINDILRENGFVSNFYQKWIVVDGVLFFTHFTGTDNAKLGAIDIIQKTLIWKHDLPLNTALIGGLYVKDSTLYIHTQDNSLYLFDLEH
ncbi:hypothetical protein IC235_15005 [Hymenobacter sp. BT664]|uniref:WD40 repeat domain-containing protein n=1 Tax=Hymenobacter montanus TaxID=2771359 RepID=A0A927BFP2_9BACT|nr:hypothetical protein [Hymenobacter montanus]MBD2769199.1 hypothetical protein [Hymenobacter montanus]